MRRWAGNFSSTGEQTVTIHVPALCKEDFRPWIDTPHLREQILQGALIRQIAFVDKDEIRQLGLLADTGMYFFGQIGEIHWIKHGNEGCEPNEWQDVFLGSLIDQFNRIGEAGRPALSPEVSSPSPVASMKITSGRSAATSCSASPSVPPIVQQMQPFVISRTA